MFLLDWYKKRNIVVAHVNYNKRSDSNNDERIIREFCDKNKIKLEVLNIKEKASGNFQSWARDVRYNFFKNIYDKYECNQLVMGHHKDDFLETAIMQTKANKKPRYFGIKKKNAIYEMNVIRPFIDLYWKDEIISHLAKDGIEYAVDSSNAEPIFERNKIRIELTKKTYKEKKSIYRWYKMSNKILKKKFKKVDYLYKKWKKTKYESAFFKRMKYKEELVFEFINDNFEDISLTRGKIKSFIEYIESNNGGKKFILNKNSFVNKSKGKLII